MATAPCWGTGAVAATGPAERVSEGSSEQPGRWWGARVTCLVTGRDARGGPGTWLTGQEAGGEAEDAWTPGLLQPPWQRGAARRPGVGGSAAPAPGSPPLGARHCDMWAGSPSAAGLTPTLSRQPPARTPALREGSLSCPSGGQFLITAPHPYPALRPEGLETPPSLLCCLCSPRGQGGFSEAKGPSQFVEGHTQAGM